MTLEPCAHHGRQPPCTGAILAAGLGRVVIASEDPSEKASGRGPGILRDEGVEVELADGPEAAAARLLNQAFRKHTRTGRPLVVLKSALSLDGRVATRGRRLEVDLRRGQPRAGSPLAGRVRRRLRRDRHRARRRPAAHGEAAHGRRRFASPPGSSSTPRPACRWARGWSARSARRRWSWSSPRPRPASGSRRSAEAGAELIVCDGDPPARVAAALAELGRRQITSLLLEGGPTLAGSFLDAGEIDELRLFIAPIVLGGAGARPLVGGRGRRPIADATPALAMDAERSGEDLLVRARLREW